MEQQTQREKYQRRALRKKIKRWKSRGLDTSELESQFEYHMTPEFRIATSEGLKQYWDDPEESHRDSFQTPEFKERSAQVALLAWETQEFKEKRYKALTDFYSIPGNREAHSKKMKEVLDTPEFKKKCSMRIGPLAANWQGGISNDPYCHKFNDDFRRNVRTFFENKCLLCLYEEVETLPQERAFCVHHVHYDKQSLCNETSPRMFAPLCDVHHGVTNGDRKFWEDLLGGTITEVYNGRSYYSEEEWNQIKGQVPAGLPEPLESAEA